MKIRNLILTIIAITTVYACGRAISGGSFGGELVGVKGEKPWAEPTPYGMVLISKSSYKMGPGEIDSLWGFTINTKGVSVDNFWMDDTEVTNGEYKQFVNWVRDSIIRERLADPAYAGDELYKIEEDEYGDPIKPYLNWKIPIPWKRNTEDEERAINSIYKTNPITGKKELDASQMNFRYEWFDYVGAAKLRNRLDPVERNRNTDVSIDPNEVIMISKDTAYINENGKVINETITRPLSSLYDFLNTRIVNIYPDTTCWVNDFDNANMEVYSRTYFANPGYNDYPVVGVTWEQATAFCEWRTMFLRSAISKDNRVIEKYRLPTEAEWEMAARSARTDNRFPWESLDVEGENGCYNANFKPGDGDYSGDNYLITARVGSFKPNNFGLFDMAGNVAEWTSTSYTESGNALMNDVNPEYSYNAAKEDPYTMKRKVVKGGSWKDIATFIRSDMREAEYQNQPRSYIGFRCVRTQISFSKSKR